MLVDVKLGKSRQIKLEFKFRLNKMGKLVVKAVNSFHNKNVVGGKLQGLSLVFAASGDKVVAWKLHLFSGEQVQKVLVYKLDVQGLDALVVVVSVFVLGSAVAANVVVVKAYDLGLVADGLQFHREFFCAGGLSRA